MMEYTYLGATGLKVSVAGLGCGGNSRLGQSTGSSFEESVAIVRGALDLGVNFFDTAEVYGTEEILGVALQNIDRDSVVISTKSRVRAHENSSSVVEVVASLDRSLQKLQTDYVDVFHVHAVKPHEYPFVRDVIVPPLLREREKGKFRHLGITETPPNDAKHAMLGKAFADDFWEVIMVGFHMMNQNARKLVFPSTQGKQIGTLIMFAVRSIFSDPRYLQTTIDKLVENGELDTKYGDTTEPLGFLLGDGDAESVIDAAYRFVRHEPGVDVVLFGTGNSEHLATNIKSILRNPLSPILVQQMSQDMGHLEGVGLDLPRNR